MNITLNQPDAAALERFFAAQRDGGDDVCLGHDPRWLNVLHQGMGQRPFSLTAWRDGQVVGWLPMVETHSVLFGRHLVSLPYLNESGVLCEDGAVAAALTARAGRLADERGARFVELRHRFPLDQPGLVAVRTDKVCMTLRLPGDEAALWDTLASKTRNQVRKGQQQPLSVRFGGAELLRAFYRVFAVNMRDLGSPVFPRRLFAAMLDQFAGEAELCVVDLNDQPVAAAVLIHHDGVTEVPSASSLRQFNPTCANMLMYWRLLGRAIARGSMRFEFGRSTIDSGTYRFKRQWGATPRPTGWQQLVLAADAKPITADDARFGRAVRVWRKLPVWLTRLAGPAIVKGIP